VVGGHGDQPSELHRINYKIGAWNSANGEEKFADYNAGSPTVFNFSSGTTGATNATRC